MGMNVVCSDVLEPPDPLRSKGVGGVIYCCTSNNYKFSSINDLDSIVDKIANILSKELGVEILKHVFKENEVIGIEFVLYKYHLYTIDGRDHVRCRIVAYRNRVYVITCTIDEKLGVKPTSRYRVTATFTSRNQSMEYMKPRGQAIIPNFIVYRILGQPRIDLSSWKLVVTGLVEKELSYTYNELLNLPQKKIVADFHCVTGWSVEKVVWEGVSLKTFAEESRVSRKVKWVYIECLDGYTTVVPYNDFVSENAILALKLNGKPLPLEQGFPARIVIPHLYGWKNAKWVSKIVFTDEYIDGFWEALGYHERGYVWYNERFKKYCLEERDALQKH